MAINFGHDQKNKILDTSGRKEFPLQGGGSLRDWVRISVTQEELRVEPLLSHREEPAEVAWASVSDALGTPP